MPGYPNYLNLYNGPMVSLLLNISSSLVNCNVININNVFQQHNVASNTHKVSKFISILY